MKAKFRYKWTNLNYSAVLERNPLVFNVPLINIGCNSGAQLTVRSTASAPLQSEYLFWSRSAADRGQYSTQICSNFLKCLSKIYNKDECLFKNMIWFFVTWQNTSGNLIEKLHNQLVIWKISEIVATTVWKLIGRQYTWKYISNCCNIFCIENVDYINVFFVYIDLALLNLLSTWTEIKCTNVNPIKIVSFVFIDYSINQERFQWSRFYNHVEMTPTTSEKISQNWSIRMKYFVQSLRK